MRRLASVTNIIPEVDIPGMLRALAYRIETGQQHAHRVTVVAGPHVWCFGPISNDRAAEGAVFDMQLGIQNIVSGQCEAALDFEEGA